jgi:hypothetical protein
MEPEEVRLAREVILKYGVDADKPSVHLAKAVIQFFERVVYLEDSVRHHNEVSRKTNEALHRAGFYSALYYWEAIDELAAERDKLKANK